MSYRKIIVNDQVFEYSVGATHTKIRGVGAYKNSEIGHYRSNSELYWPTLGSTFQVRPSDIASFIKQHRLKMKK